MHMYVLICQVAFQRLGKSSRPEIGADVASHLTLHAKGQLILSGVVSLVDSVASSIRIQDDLSQVRPKNGIHVCCCS